MKWSGEDYSIISTHVDDILQVSTSQELVSDLHENLLIEYGDVAFNPNADSYIGLSIERSKDLAKFKLTQRGLTDKILLEHLPKRANSKPSKSPASDKLFSNEKNPKDEHVDKKKFLSLIMSLMYLARLTRPDILLPVTYLATKSHNATTTDWNSAMRILSYLDGTRSKGVIIHCTDLSIHAICDASH